MHKHARVLDKPMPHLKEYSVEQLREALQGRWEMFMSFSLELRKALEMVVRTRSTAMVVIEAETDVTLLHQMGILNVADNGQVRDVNGRAAATGVMTARRNVCICCTRRIRVQDFDL